MHVRSGEHAAGYSAQAPDGLPLAARWTPEGQLLIRCARTVTSEPLRRRIVEAARQPLNWMHFLDLAHFHGVGPLVYRTLRSLCADCVPQEAMDTLRHRTQAGTVFNRVLAQELIGLCRAFAEHGVPAIPFKGATLAAMAYGDLTLRDFDDLDFIVPQQRLADAQAVLCAQGYQPRGRTAHEETSPHADEPYHVLVKPNSLFRVDVQWVMAHELFAFRLDRAEVWKRLTRISMNGQQVRGLAPEDLLIMLCVHGTMHAWERLKWVVDVAELIRAQRLDWRRVYATATAWKCQRMVLLGLALAHYVMDAAIPHALLDDMNKDADVRALALRMPTTLLVVQREGIDEADGPALYWVLKDSRWERWQYGAALLCQDHSILQRLPHWFRWKRPMSLLGKCMRVLRAPFALCTAKSVRRMIARWHQPAH